MKAKHNEAGLYVKKSTFNDYNNNKLEKNIYKHKINKRLEQNLDNFESEPSIHGSILNFDAGNVETSNNKDLSNNYSSSKSDK